MNYEATLQWMFAQLPMFQRQGKMAFKKDLTNSIAIARHLGNPELNFKTIHVAGTNGKGSTSHMLASILQESGLKVGLYTSPHLKDFRERIRINGQLIPKEEVIAFVETNKSFLEIHQLSFFEMTVALAFHCFSVHSVDVAVVEVGLGGRLDSTNIIQPDVCVITNIGYDHTQLLGETLPEIAGEKAGIIKEGIPIVIGEYQEEVFPIFEHIAKGKGAKLYVASAKIGGNYTTDLLGKYQVNNLKTTVQTVEVLRELGYAIPEEHVVHGLNRVVANTGLLGRWQVLGIHPKIICDTAHNVEGLQVVIDQLKEESFDDLHVVLGMVNDKNLARVLPLFPTDACYYFCSPDIPRGMEANELYQAAQKYGLNGTVFNSVKEAYSTAVQEAKPGDLVYVGGSTFVVAEVL